MQIEIITSEEIVEGTKRQNLPITINWICPTCGTKHSDDYAEGNYYAPCAKFGGDCPAINEIYLYCDDCCEFEATKEVGLQIKVVLLEGQ